MIKNFDELLARGKEIKGKRIAVVFPANAETFSAIEDALKMDLAEFVLIGDRNYADKFLPTRDARVKLIQAPTAQEALNETLAILQRGEADVVMKGSVDTSTLMKTILKEDSGLRTGRLLSDVFIFEFPPRLENKLVMITDGGVTLAPDLKDKVELIRNAVDVAHALGNANPKVAVLSATEFVVPTLQSTMDAAVLSKMNERGQIKGCIVDGPLALDNAISPEAAEEKGLKSPVAGRAEILLAMNIESANSLAKSTTYFAGYRLAHVIVGGTVPVLIPSRADKSDAKLLSIVLGMIMSEFYTKKAS